MEALLAIVGLAVGAVDFAGLTRHVGQQFQRVLVRRSQRQQPLLEPDLILYSITDPSREREREREEEIINISLVTERGRKVCL